MSRSIEAAVEAYRSAGGCASIFVNDDGLQLLGEAARMRRIQCVQLLHPFTDKVFDWLGFRFQ